MILLIFGRNVKWCSHFGKHMEVPKKLKHRTTIWSSHPTSGYSSRGNKKQSLKKTYAPLCSLQRYFCFVLKFVYFNWRMITVLWWFLSYISMNQPWVHTRVPPILEVLFTLAKREKSNLSNQLLRIPFLFFLFFGVWGLNSKNVFP